MVRRELGHDIVNALVSDVSVRPALTRAWYIATDQLGTMNIRLLIMALITVVGLSLSGSGRISSDARDTIAPWLVNPLYAFGVPALVLLILIVWGPLQVVQKLIPAGIIAVLSGIGIEALRRQTIAEHAPPAPAPPG